MTKNSVIVLLALATFAGYSYSQNLSGNSATVASPGNQPGIPTAFPVQLAQAQQPAPPVQPVPTQQAAPAVRGEQPGLQPGIAQSTLAQPPNSGVQPLNPRQNTMPMGGMGCMMGGMNMGGMNMSGTSGMSAMSGMGGTGHTMDQGLTMREIVYIVSMQDAIQVLNDMIQFQEKVIENSGPREDSLRKELAQMRERTRKLALDYRSILTNQMSR